MKIVTTFIFCLFVFSATAQQHNPGTPRVAFDSSLLYKDTIIHWMTIEEAELAQKKNQKKIFVNVYATWCRWCLQEDSLTFKNREIAHYINQNFYAVRFNAETKTPVTFKGVKYVFLNDESKFVHDFARYLLTGRLSYPGTAFLDEQGNLISAKNGYMDAYYLEAVLNYYATGAYKKMNYYDFEFDFEGKIED